MSKLPPMPRPLLKGFEKVAVPVMESFNGNKTLRRLLHGTNGKFNAAWIDHALGNLTEIHGLEQLLQAQVPRGLILVSNHRSFFDMYVISTVICRRTRLMDEVMYPVRSPFFYDHPLGVVLNLAVAGGSMWPPVFRDDRRRILNPVGFEQMAATLGPGMVMGIHPEGTRSQGDDPYSYLPRKPGLGQLLQVCDPEVRVLPCFIAGMSSSFQREVGRNFKPKGKRGEPIRVWLGEVMRAGDAVSGLADPAEIVERVWAEVAALGERDRAERLANPSVR